MSVKAIYGVTFNDSQECEGLCVLPISYPAMVDIKTQLIKT